MKRILLTLVACIAALALQAGELEWLTDLTRAQALAKSEKKAVLIDFTGSDWCGFCIKLDKQVFATKEFADYAKDNLVLVSLDFPRKKEQTAELKAANAKLKSRYEVSGFPTVIMIDSEGRILGKQVGYAGDPAKAYIEKLKSWQAKLK